MLSHDRSARSSTISPFSSVTARSPWSIGSLLVAFTWKEAELGDRVACRRLQSLCDWRVGSGGPSFRQLEPAGGLGVAEWLVIEPSEKVSVVVRVKQLSPCTTFEIL